MNKFIPALIPALALVLAGAGQVAQAADAATTAKPAAAKTAKPAAKAPAKTAKGTAKTADAGKAPGQPDNALPEDVLKQMGELIEKAIQPASGPLQTSDDFQPYGVLMHQDGSLQVVRWTQPNPPPPMELLKKIFRAVMIESLKPDVIAAATVAPSSVPTADAKTRVKGIRAEVDHRRGEPRVVFIPYTHENGKLVLGTTIYLPGVNPVFEHPKAGGAPAPQAEKAGAEAAPTASPAAPAAVASPAAAQAAPPADAPAGK